MTTPMDLTDDERDTWNFAAVNRGSLASELEQEHGLAVQQALQKLSDARATIEMLEDQIGRAKRDGAADAKLDLLEEQTRHIATKISLSDARAALRRAGEALDECGAAVRMGDDAYTEMWRRVEVARAARCHIAHQVDALATPAPVAVPEKEES